MKAFSTTNLESEVIDWLNDQDDDTLIEIWNHIQIEHCTELDIFPMYDLEDQLEGMELIDIVREFCNSQTFDPYDDWFYINVCGFHSFCKPNPAEDSNSPIDIAELAHMIVCDDDYCGEGELEEILRGESRFEEVEDEEVEDEEF